MQAYVSYGTMSVIYDTESDTFCVNNGYEKVISDAKLVIVPHGENDEIMPESFNGRAVEHTFNTENNTLTVSYSRCEKIKAEPSIRFSLDKTGLLITVYGLMENSSYFFGQAYWGNDMSKDTFAMSLKRSGTDARCAIGPATSAVDNALYDRRTDSAFVIDGGRSVRFSFNWEEKRYNFKLTTGAVEFQQRFKLYVKSDILADKYSIDFSPINKNSTFKKPPAGWMTWYAVKFDASEKAVLENVEFQEKNLKRYGADTVWVDWEWYHKDFSGERDDGCDTFTPDIKKYPHGLKFVSDKIKKAGFTPALWIGFTNDSSDNKFTRDNPQIILQKKATWCGSYFYDFSHPDYLNKFLPEALAQVSEWGYEAVKFDTLPSAIDYHEEFHMNMYNPKLTTREAFRGAMKKTRELLGKDMYMLSCAAVKDADFLWAADIFDAGRVGNDIFDWKDFIEAGVGRIMKFYPLHNIVIYPDPDNVVLREEFNTFSQSSSRIFFVSMLGLPMTFGDDFKSLDEKRIDLIKKCLPVMDIHPMDINNLSPKDEILLINLAIELQFESYNIVNVFNLTDSTAQRNIYIDKDLHLDSGKYHVFDFTDEKYLGAIDDFVAVETMPCESKILCVRKALPYPQLLSTSRHITQGAAEIKALEQSKHCTKLSAELIGGDEYRIYLHIPAEFKFSSSDKFISEQISKEVFKLSFTPENDATYDFEIKY